MSKIGKKNITNIQGVLDIQDNGTINVCMEDVETPFKLNELFEEYDNKEVKISITYAIEIN